MFFNHKINYPSNLMFWLICFCFSSSMALIFQKVILPMWPEMHAGYGLLKNDAIEFHQIALKMANDIKMKGFNEFSLFTNRSTANVGLLTIVYYLFGPNPIFFIPLNAGAHSIGALLIYNFGKLFSNNDVGKLGGLIGAIMFLSFPSSLLWYGQNHKDAFFIFSILLCLFCFIKIYKSKPNLNIHFFKYNFLFLFSVLIISLMRPHSLIIIMISILVAFLFMIMLDFLYKKKFFSFKIINIFFLIFCFFISFKIIQTISPAKLYLYGAINKLDTNISNNVKWEKNENIPPVIDNTFKRGSEIRFNFIEYNNRKKASTVIDANYKPNSTLEVLSYLPRALFVGVFSPFPHTWSEITSILHLLISLESIIWYLMMLGIFFIKKLIFKPEVIGSIIFCSFLIMIFSYVTPNLGSLYRVRFSFWLFYLLLGCIGWAKFFINYSNNLSSQKVSNNKIDFSYNTNYLKEKIQFGSGIIVIILTFLTYFSFFIRDLYLISFLNSGLDLDLYFTSSMIIMFFVSIMIIPFGETLINPLVKKKDLVEKNLIVNRSIFLMLVLAMLASFFIFLMSNTLVQTIISYQQDTNSNKYILLLIPILVLSIFTIIGNTFLNVNKSPLIPALGQLFTGIIILIFIFVDVTNSLIDSVILGMLSGIIFNIFWIYSYMFYQGYRFHLVLPNVQFLNEIFKKYMNIVLISFFPALLVPINYYFAGNFSSGSISIWSFSSKLIILFSSLTSVFATSIIMPYISRVISNKKFKSQDTQSHFVISVGIYAGGFLMFIGIMFIDPLINMTIRDNLLKNQLSDLYLLLKLGFLQIPFVIIFAITNKILIASNETKKLLIITILMFSVNIISITLLIEFLGILSIPLSSLISLIFSTILNFILLQKRSYLKIYQILISFCSCFLWVILSLMFSASDIGSILILVIIFIIILWLQFLPINLSNKLISFNK